jgi:hypothetical protein
VGAKTGFSIRQGQVRRRPQYGEWIVQEIKCSFNPRPKRWSQHEQRLIPWRYVDVESIPYDRAISDDGVELALAELVAMEQPNADFADVQ